MVIRLLAVALMYASLLSLTGCASIVSGRTQEVTFKSVPDGATVVINGKEMGKTPFTTALDRKSDQTIIFQKDGYKSETMPLATTMNGWFFGNIVLGGLVGSTTDLVTGAAIEYSPTMYQITLAPTASISSAVQQDADVRTFIVANYKNIIDEIGSTPGTYLGSLWNLLKITPEKQAEALAKLKELAESNKDIAEFARKAAQNLIVK